MSAVRGSCLCGAVRLTLVGPSQAGRLCHCGNCRKFAGTSPAAWAIARVADLRVQGDEHVSRYDSGGGMRCFCVQCGSPVWFESKDHPEIVVLPHGVVDEGALAPPEMHLWMSVNPPWCVVNDALPQHDTHPFGDPGS